MSENEVETKKDDVQAKKGGLPWGVIAVFAIALLVGFVMANPGILGQPKAGGTQPYVQVAQQASGANAGSGASGTAGNSAAAAPSGDVQTIKMTVDGSGYTPNSFVLKKGVKVRWIIDAKTLTGCNKEIKVPSYNLDIKLQQGENVVEFTPDKEGTVNWSCWMGMIRGNFVVVADPANQAQVSAAVASAPAPAKSSGGCGCGGGGADFLEFFYFFL